MTLTPSDAIHIIETGAAEEDYIEAFQTLIDTAIVWQLQGWYGRRAEELIKAGLCAAPEWVEKEKENV